MAGQKEFNYALYCLFVFSDVTWEALQNAVITADPEIESEPVKLEALLTWAFRVKDRSQLEEDQAIPTDDLEQRLINGNIKRVGENPL